MITAKRDGLTMTLKGSLISHSVTHRRDAKDAEACFFAFLDPVKSHGVSGKGKIIHLCVLCASSEAGGAK